MTDLKDVKILFFGSGDFPVRTFERLISSGFNIVGLVTSRDKVFFESKRLAEIAAEHEIPTVIPKNLDDPEFLSWLDEHPADIFCVISYKFLSAEILSRAKRLAFNIHASLLPFLRGASPISWAIFNEFTETGLTAFILSDKIDAGDILDNVKTTVDEKETYGTLYEKLASLSPEFTEKVIRGIMSGEYQHPIAQSDPQDMKMSKALFVAPKITTAYTTMPPETVSIEILEKTIRSISPKRGLTLPVNVYGLNENADKVIMRTLTIIVYEAEILPFEHEPLTAELKHLKTDYKTYMCFYTNKFEQKALFIKKAQIAGKNILPIEELLRGLQYLRDIPMADMIIE